MPSIQLVAGYGEGMAHPAAATPLPSDPPGNSPRAIRATLLPEEKHDFDRDYQHALKVAAETLSLDELHRTLEHWHRIARITQADPAAHRRMLLRAEQTLRTGQPAVDSVSADDVQALLRERLG
jgi:hypothetical protein